MEEGDNRSHMTRERRERGRERGREREGGREREREGDRWRDRGERERGRGRGTAHLMYCTYMCACVSISACVYNLYPTEKFLQDWRQVVPRTLCRCYDDE